MSLTLLQVQLCTCRAQHDNRDFIKQQIIKYGSCRNVAITMYNGDLVLCGTDGWAANDCPVDLTMALHEMEKTGEFVEDVHLTENGNWLIQYGSNRFRWSGIPRALKKKLKQYLSQDETVTSVSFNDYGDWIIVAEDHFSASDPDLESWLTTINDEHGQIWATCVTDDAVVVCENGFGYLGEIPSTLADALQNTDIFIRKLKIAGDSWFFSDGIDDYDYLM